MVYFPVKHCYPYNNSKYILSKHKVSNFKTLIKKTPSRNRQTVPKIYTELIVISIYYRTKKTKNLRRFRRDKRDLNFTIFLIVPLPDVVSKTQHKLVP